jgi:dipeptidyl aminopeptidase/acylaminoacyl peptidase
LDWRTPLQLLYEDIQTMNGSSITGHLLIIGITIVLVSACATDSETSINGDAQPFFFEEVESSIVAPPVHFLSLSDGVRMAYRVYTPSDPQGIVIIVHGGGAHSAAGYQQTATPLAEDYSFLVITPDLRGHGNSGGARDGRALIRSWTYRELCQST